MSAQVRYYGDKISNRIAKTPEGFLICQDVPISRTGYQEYLASELSDNPMLKHKIVPVYRPAAEVFDIRSLASFEGKPVTNEHPDEDVTPENYSQYSCGHVQNVHAGDGEDSNKVLADLYITDPTLIHLIENGKREISCGYYAEEKKDSSGKIYQTKIRGNHVAVVKNGRAGNKVCIRDRNPFDGRNLGMRRKRSLSSYIDGLRYLDDDEILVDDDELLEDEDEILEDDDYIGEENVIEDDDYVEDEDEILEDDDYLEDGCRYEDEDEYLEDDDELLEDDDELLEDAGVKGMKRGQHVKARDPEYVESLRGGGGGMSTAKKVALGVGGAAAAIGGAALAKKFGLHTKAAGLAKQGLAGFKGSLRKPKTDPNGFESIGPKAKPDYKNMLRPKNEPAWRTKFRGFREGLKQKFRRKGRDSKYWDELPYYDDDIILEDEDYLEDDDIILEDEDYLEDDDELLGDEDYLEDDNEYIEDDDEILEDDDYLEDDDEILEDDDELLEDEDEILEDDDADLTEKANSILTDAKRTLRDARAELHRMRNYNSNRRMMDAIILNDDDILEDDDEEILTDEDLLEDEDEILEDDDELAIQDDDEILEDDDEILEDNDEVLLDACSCHDDDDVEVTETEEIKDAESDAIDTEKTKALREITEASRGISDPNERKQLQDAIYKALCGKTQMADVMRITKRNKKARMDSMNDGRGKMSVEKQQAIYDSFNPHKKTSF